MPLKEKTQLPLHSTCGPSEHPPALIKDHIALAQLDYGLLVLYMKSCAIYIIKAGLGQIGVLEQAHETLSVACRCGGSARSSPCY